MFALVREHGTTWRKIATMLGTGRSTAFVRNRFYSAIRTVQRSKGLSKEQAKQLIAATGGIEGLSVPSTQAWQEQASQSQMQEYNAQLRAFSENSKEAGLGMMGEVGTGVASSVPSSRGDARARVRVRSRGGRATVRRAARMVRDEAEGENEGTDGGE